MRAFAGWGIVVAIPAASCYLCAQTFFSKHSTPCARESIVPITLPLGLVDRCAVGGR